MAKPNSRINPHEREIGLRLQDFREGIRYSQPQFAKVLGLSRDQLAAIEYGRTPIRYSLAWEIRNVFGLSVDYLWGGFLGPDDLVEDLTLPDPESPQLKVGALLTEVLNKVYRLGRKPADSKRTTTPKPDRAEIVLLDQTSMMIERDLRRWLASLPDTSHLDDFHEHLRQAAKHFFKSFPNQSEEIVLARLHALIIERMRHNHFERSFRPKDCLTCNSLKSKSEDVKSELQKLIAQVRKLASRPGAKSELARFLGVAPARITEWLHEDPKLNKKPGGEYTLLLLKWVRQNQGQ